MAQKPELTLGMPASERAKIPILHSWRMTQVRHQIDGMAFATEEGQVRLVPLWEDGLRILFKEKI